jgi:hypothetical protein
MSEQQQQKTSVKLAVVLGVVALAWYVLSMLVVLHG